MKQHVLRVLLVLFPVVLLASPGAAQTKPPAKCLVSLLDVRKAPNHVTGSISEPGPDLALNVSVAKSTACNDQPIHVGFAPSYTCKEMTFSYAPRVLSLNPTPGNTATGSVTITSSAKGNCSFLLNLSCPGGGDDCVKHPGVVNTSPGNYDFTGPQ